MKIYSWLFMVGLQTMAQAQTQSAKISPVVEQQFQAGATAVSCWIVLPQQAPTSFANSLHTKTEKGTFVFQSLTQTADQSQRDLRQWLHDRNILFQPFYIVNAIEATVDAATLQALVQREDVARILPNTPIQAHQPVQMSPSWTRSGGDTLTWGIQRVQAHRLWQRGIRGRGVVVGGQDTGYDWWHPTIHPQYRGWNTGSASAQHDYHWHDAIHVPDAHHSDTINPCGYNLLEPCDDGSHGTHTMGTMVGTTDNDSMHVGLAPDARWIGCRNMERGWGKPSTYIECFEWFLAPTNLQNSAPNPALAPHVINNSWGCPPSEGCDSSNFEMMRLAVANLRNAGIVVVVSAGNSGSGCHTISDPAAMFGESFTIAASNEADTIAPFSSRGKVAIDGSFRPKPNVSAPGTNVYSTFPSGSFGRASGTSMAAPHVAGVIALLISADPTLAGNVERIEELLEKTAQPVWSAQVCDGANPAIFPNPIAGYGRIDAWAALAVVRPDLVLAQPLPTSDLRLYPNPVLQNAYLITPADMGAGTYVRVYNPLGQLLSETQRDFTRMLELELDWLPSGFYVLELENKASQQRCVKRFYKR